jgi:hypothetical protein
MDKKIKNIINEIDGLITINKSIFLFEQATENTVNNTDKYNDDGTINFNYDPKVAAQKSAFNKVSPNAKPKNKEEKIKYFDFGGISKIPYVAGTKFYKLENIDTGKILGLTQKDKYGYYEEINIDNYNEPIRRYYPTNDWEDWQFIQKKGIPYAFKTPDGKFFHLILKLINPTKSVTDLENSNNKSRGWALSYPGSKTSVGTDSGTGYYTTEGNTQVAYNITAPIVPGDLSTFDLDTRGEFDKFMDSGFGILAQIGTAIAVTVLTRNLAIGQTVAQGIVSTNAIRTRLFVASLLSETVVNAPVAIYYFNREGYESAGWLSLAFIALPVIQRFSGLRNILPDFSVKTCYELSAKIMANKLEAGMTQAQMKTFMNTLTMEEKVLFTQVLKNAEKITPKITSVMEKVATKSYKGKDYLTYKAEIVALLEKAPEKTLITMAKDFGITFTYIKLVEVIMGTYESILKKQNVDLNNLPKKEKEKIVKNVKKIDDEIKLLPEWSKYFLSGKNEESGKTKIPKFELSEYDVQYLIENGVLGDKLKKQMADQAANSMMMLIEQSNKKGIRIKELLNLEEFNLISEYNSNPEKFCTDYGPEQCEKFKKINDENIRLFGKPQQQTLPTEYEDVIYQYFNVEQNEWKTVTKRQYEVWQKKGKQTRTFQKNTEQN